MRRFWLLLALLALVSGSAFAKHDWTAPPEQTKCKFVSNMKGLVLGVTVITNFSTIPPKGKYYPGIGIFTNLISRGAKIVCYNQWEGPEVGMDAEVPYNLKKNIWYYKDEDEPIVSFSSAKKKFSYNFPQKEFSELDYCLVYKDVIYPLNINCSNSKLTYKGTFVDDFAEGYDIIDDEINFGLYSVQTNRWFIGDPVTLQTANHVAYKGGFTLTNGCKVTVKFNAKSWALNYKIADPAGEWVVPGSNRELGVKWLKLDGREIKDGMSGENFLFTNDVLVLYNYRGQKLEFKGGLDIMCPYGSTNIFENRMEPAFRGSYGFCNFLGYGRVVFRGTENALRCRLCGLLLNEVDSFNADEMPEVIVDNEYYISAPFELLIDGKSAMYNKKGPGWRYEKGSLYLDNFQGTNIYCDGYLKVFLEPNSQNTVHGLFDSGYGNVRFFGNENATLTLGGIDHSYGDILFSNITVNVTQEHDYTDFSIFTGNLYGRNSTINIFPAEGQVAMLYVASGGIALTNCALNVKAMEDLAVMTDGNLQLVDSSLDSDGMLEISENAKLLNSKVTVGSSGDYSLRVFGNLLTKETEMDLGSCLDVYGKADIAGGKLTLVPDDFGDAVSVQDLTKARDAEINITGCASFMTNVYLENCVFEIFSKETNAFLCDNSLSLTKTKLTATSLAQAIVCQDFQANNSDVTAETIKGGFGVVSETVTLEGREGELNGCVKCDEFLMRAGNFTADGDIPLEAGTSVEFQGGNALLTGLIEAVLCPFDAIMADGSEESLAGFKLIEIKNGFVKRKE